MAKYAIIVHDEKTGGSYQLQKKYATRARATRRARVIQKTYPTEIIEIKED